jgi:hypothetical protein
MEHGDVSAPALPPQMTTIQPYFGHVCTGSRRNGPYADLGARCTRKAVSHACVGPGTSVATAQQIHLIHVSNFMLQMGVTLRLRKHIVYHG